MGSTREPPPPPSSAEITARVKQRTGLPILVDGATMSKLKASIMDTVHIGDNICRQAQRRFQFALNGKLFGKFLRLRLLKLFC